MTNAEEFAGYLAEPEGARLEFKAARNNYGFDELIQYSVALANEGGGKLILGVTDQRPRNVVGTNAFPDPGQTEASVYDRLGRRVSIEEYLGAAQRILIVHVPSREPGNAWNDRGRYWMRAGEALVPMGDDELRRIHAEIASDLSAEYCVGVTLRDLDPEAIAEFRLRWARRDRLS